MSKRKSKLKKNIRKLEDDEDFGVNIDSKDSEEIFDEYMSSEKFSPTDKFDDTPVIDTSRHEQKSKSQSEESKFRQVMSLKIDLHGFSSMEAVRHVESVIEESEIHCNILKLKIITGRGVSSGPNGPILAREVHNFISSKFKKRIVKIESSPAESMIGSVSIRGYFNVHLRC
jgi:DNA-nicking Smr family endonuclease